jgi:AcrR family transcriptional regulator
VLENVARDAGYTRGALYHQFANKEALALAVVGWVEKGWVHELWSRFPDSADPVRTLVELARGYAVYCRDDVSRVMQALRAEFEGNDHAVGRAVTDAIGRGVDLVDELITAGRRAGAIPPGPPSRELALAFAGGIEGLVVYLAGHEPWDVELAERVALGLLGVELPTE